MQFSHETSVMRYDLASVCEEHLQLTTHRAILKGQPHYHCNGCRLLRCSFSPMVPCKSSRGDLIRPLCLPNYCKNAPGAILSTETLWFNIVDRYQPVATHMMYQAKRYNLRAFTSCSITIIEAMFTVKQLFKCRTAFSVKHIQ